MAIIKLLLSYLFVSAGLSLISAETNEQDAKVMLALKDKWSNTPQSWGASTDPCGAKWEGVTCDGNNRVTELTLPSSGLTGNFPDDIGNLTELTSLDLSFNQGLTGPLSPSLGNLSKLFTLTLEACNFTGSIPSELGNAATLSYISLAGNNLTGDIPSSIGKLSNLRWLDLADNWLSGSIPISNSGTLGLDQLKKLQALVLSNNEITGSIQKELFSSETSLTKLLIRANKLSGEIPDTLFQVHTLEVLDLAENSLTGTISSNINTLTSLTYLSLEGNNFTGKIPDLTGMDSLNFVLLSNNSFDTSEAPAWFSSLQHLQVLFLEHASLYGPIPSGIFSLPQLNTVILNNNQFNGTLDMSIIASDNLVFVDFENNKISELKLKPEFNNTLLLAGNSYCEQSANAYQSICKPYTL